MADIDKGDPKRTATYRAALAAVIILSVLLVVALVAVVAGFVRQARLYQASHAAASAAPMAAIPLAGMPAAAEMTLAPGAHILSATTDSGKLVLHVHTPAGDEVDIIDLASGKLTSRITDGPK